jgi:hypothetical protein
LIAFFFEIGLSGLPNWDMVFIALILLVLVVFKGGLFMYIFTRFNIRARSSFLASMSLTTYSEFGLIVAAIGVEAGWLDGIWLVTIALALSFSFLLTAPFNHNAHSIFNRYKTRFMRLNTCKIHPDDEPSNLGDAQYLVCGIGRIGRSVYRQLENSYGKKVLGIDYNFETVEKAQAEGKNVIWGDVTDSNFWQNANLQNIQMIFLSFTNHSSNVNTSIELNNIEHENIKVGAVCEYRDQAKELHDHGVDFIYNFRERVGEEFAKEFLLNHAS